MEGRALDFKLEDLGANNGSATYKAVCKLVTSLTLSSLSDMGIFITLSVSSGLEISGTMNAEW